MARGRRRAPRRGRAPRANRRRMAAGGMGRMNPGRPRAGGMRGGMNSTPFHNPFNEPMGGRGRGGCIPVGSPCCYGRCCGGATCNGCDGTGVNGVCGGGRTAGPGSYGRGGRTRPVARRGGNIRKYPHGGSSRDHGLGPRRKPPGWRDLSIQQAGHSGFQATYAHGGLTRRGCGMYTGQIECQQNGCHWDFNGPSCH